MKKKIAEAKMKRKANIEINAKPIGLFIGVIVFAVLAAVFPAVLAAEKIVDKSFANSESIVINDRTFQIYIELPNNRINIHHEGRITPVANSTCRRINTTNWCLNTTEFDESAKEYKSKVTAYSLAAKVNARISSSSRIVLGENAELVFYANNSGDIQAKDFSYVQEFPKDIVILSSSGCVRENNIIYYQGVINPSQSIECTITITTNQTQDRTLSAIVEYFSGDKIEKKILEPIQFKAVPQVTVSTVAGTNKLYIGDRTNITFNFTNINNSRIEEVSVEFDFPGTTNASQSKKISSGAVISGRENKFASNFSLGRNQTISIAFDMIGTRIGNGVLEARIKYKLNSNWLAGQAIQYNVETAANSLEINTNFDNEQIETGETKVLMVYARNPNPNAALKDISILQSSTLFGNKTIYLAEINGSQERIIESVKITGSDNSESSKANYYSQYYTEFGDVLNVTKDKTISFKKAANLGLTVSVTPNRVSSGEEIVVRVDISNPRDLNLRSIRVYDTINSAVISAAGTAGSPAVKTFGPRDTLIDLDSGKGATAYIYRIEAPKVNEPVDFYINTTAAYNSSGKDYLFVKQNSFTVIPKKILISAQKTMDSYSMPAGKFAAVNYKLTNNDEQIAYNIRIISPSHQGLEQIQRQDKLVDVLLPKETVTLSSVESVRGVSSGTFIVPGSDIFYTDKNGNLFNITTNSMTLTVSKSFIREPSIQIEKTVENGEALQALRGEKAKASVTLRVKNVGRTVIGPISVSDSSDSSHHWTILSLDDGSEAILKYDAQLAIGTHTLSSAKAAYNFNGVAIVSESKPATAEVKQKKAEVAIMIDANDVNNANLEQDKIKTSSADNQQQEDNIPVVIIEESKPSILGNVWQFLKKILYWRKSK